jgi:hypothetical protein
VRHIARIGEMRNAHGIFVGPVGNRTLVRPRRRWEENIRLDLRKMGWEIANWIHLA